MITFVLFIIGFFLLIKSADILVDGASSLARRMKVSSIVIGLTVVALGTSMPEFVVTTLATINGNTDIAIGNILGSNIANILLIVGLSAYIFPLKAKPNTIWKEIPFCILAAILLFSLSSDALIDGANLSQMARIDGIVLLSFFAIFLYYIVTIAKDDDESIAVATGKDMSVWKSILYSLIGILGLVIGGNWIVEGATQIASMMGVSQALIGLTVVAVGTSLPELATSVVAATKKQSDIAIGNIVGSNIFNTFWILGFSAFIKPLPFAIGFQRDSYVNIAAAIILFLVMFIGKKHIIEKWQGILMLGGYVAYVVVSVYLA